MVKELPIPQLLMDPRSRRLAVKVYLCRSGSQLRFYPDVTLLCMPVGVDCGQHNIKYVSTALKTSVLSLADENLFLNGQLTLLSLLTQYKFE